MNKSAFSVWLCVLACLGFGCGQGDIKQQADLDAGYEIQDAGAGDDSKQGDSGDQNIGSDVVIHADGDTNDSDMGYGDDENDGGQLDSGDDDEHATCSSGQSPALGTVSAEQLHSELEQKDFLLINVASASGGQIPGTDTYIPYNDTQALIEFIGSDLDVRVVLYCASGGRSGVAGRSLVEHGYCSIRHLLGGMNAWTAAGYPLE